MKSDSQIQQDVLHELKWDSRVEETDVGVEVDGGVVTLSGTVSDYMKKTAAQDAAHRVAGVMDVVDQIQVHPRGTFQPTDVEISQAVRNALESDVAVPDAQIRSTIASGRVTLEGEVTTWYERDAAQRAVRHLVGVRSVINHLEVAPTTVQAESIRAEIEHTLVRRAERHARQIRVEVRNGTVSIAGSVHSWHEHEAVLEAARAAAGGRKVDDLLTVEIGGA